MSFNEYWVLRTEKSFSDYFTYLSIYVSSYSWGSKGLRAFSAYHDPWICRQMRFRGKQLGWLSHLWHFALAPGPESENILLFPSEISNVERYSVPEVSVHHSWERIKHITLRIRSRTWPWNAKPCFYTTILETLVWLILEQNVEREW